MEKGSAFLGEQGAFSAVGVLAHQRAGLQMRISGTVGTKPLQRGSPLPRECLQGLGWTDQGSRANKPIEQMSAWAPLSTAGTGNIRNSRKDEARSRQRIWCFPLRSTPYKSGMAVEPTEKEENPNNDRD